MFLQHGVDPSVIDDGDWLQLLELLNTPDENPVYSASQLDSAGFYDQDDIWDDE